MDLRILVCLFMILPAKSSAQVYNYFTLEHSDFEINPAILGLSHEFGSQFANYSEFGNKTYQSKSARAGTTALIGPLNCGITFNPNFYQNGVAVGVFSFGTGHNLKLNSRINLALGINYKFFRGNISSGNIDYLKQNVLAGANNGFNGFNSSIVFSDSNRRVFFSLMALNLTFNNNHESPFPRYFALVTGNILSLIYTQPNSIAYIESYIKYSKLETKPLTSTIVHYRRPIFSLSPKNKLLLGGACGYIDQNYFRYGMNLRLESTSSDEIVLGYDVSDLMKDGQNFSGFYFSLKGNISRLKKPVNKKKRNSL